VQAAFQPGTYLQRTYAILSAAGGVAGAFDALTTTNLPAGFTTSLSYSGSDVILNLTAMLGEPGLAPLPPGGLKVSQSNVAAALNDYFNKGGVLPPEFVTVFRLTGPNLGLGLSQLSGELGTAAASTGFRSMDQFLGLMLDPFLGNRVGGGNATSGPGPALAFASADDAALDYAQAMVRNAAVANAPLTFEPRWSTWGAGYGSHGSFSGNASVGSHGLSINHAGVAGGVDYRFGDSVIGAALTGQSLSYGLAAGLGSGAGDGVQGGLYGSTKWGNAYLSAAASFGWYDLDTTRLVLLGVTDRLTAHISAASLGGRIEGGYRFPVLASSGLTPYAAMQGLSFRTGAYAERDVAGLAGFGLTYGANTTHDLRSELGLRFDTRWALTDTAMLTLRGRAAWAHTFETDRAIGAAFQTLPGAGFTVFGASPAENAALLSALAELRLAKRFSLLAKFDGEFGRDTRVYAGSGTLRYAW
jgi:outer membrane autotransporter protein